MIEKISIEKLNKATYNPRVELNSSMPDYWKLRNSIEKFGNVEPIVWNKRTGNVVGGHQRLKVLTDIGETEVDCHVVDLDEDEEKILNLALNKIKGEWDYEKLEDILKEIDDKEITGFTPDELSIILSENEDGISEDFDFGDWFEDEANIYTSFVVVLKFDSNESAKEWADSHGFEGKVKVSSTTTVIRIEEDDD